MAEYDKTKLYFLKLDKDFFQKHFMRILGDMPNGDRYILFLLKLMCESTPYNGYLRYSREKPYTCSMLAALTGTEEGIVKDAMKTFSDFGLVNYTQDQSIFIPLVEEMTISHTKGALDKQEQRKKKEQIEDNEPIQEENTEESLSWEEMMKELGYGD